MSVPVFSHSYVMSHPPEAFVRLASLLKFAVLVFKFVASFMLSNVIILPKLAYPYSTST